MAVLVRLLRSQLILGWALLMHLVTRPWKRLRGRVTTSSRWLEWLARERVGATPEGMWSLSAQASRCVGCGLCDSVGEKDERPSQWIMADARQPQDARWVQLRAQRLRQLAPDIAKVCPTDVDVKSVAQWIEAHGHTHGHGQSS